MNTSQSSKSIVFVTSTDFTKASAATNRLLAIARGLCENGVSVSWILLASTSTEHIIKDKAYSEISFFHLSKSIDKRHDNRYILLLYRIVSLCKLSKNLKAIERKHPVNACFTVGSEWFFLYIILSIFHRRRINVYHERTEYPKLELRNNIWGRINLFLYYSLCVCRMDHIYVISTALQTHFTEYLAKRGNKNLVSILNMMVEPERYALEEQSSFRSDTLDIVYIGTMYGDKDGVYYLISAFKAIQSQYPKARLILVGDTAKRSQMKKVLELADPKEKNDRIVFTGRLDRIGVVKYLNQAYCLALSRPDNIQAKYGFPTKLGEYLSTGKPVIVTKVGDIPIYLKDGENAFLAEPDSVSSFANKLRQCLDNPDLAISVGQEGLQLANSIFNYQSCTQSLLRDL